MIVPTPATIRTICSDIRNSGLSCPTVLLGTRENDGIEIYKNKQVKCTKTHVSANTDGKERGTIKAWVFKSHLEVAVIFSIH